MGQGGGRPGGRGCDVGLAQRPLRPGFLIQREPASRACLFLAGRLVLGGWRGG